jgi:hypothetical protein
MASQDVFEMLFPDGNLDRQKLRQIIAWYAMRGYLPQDIHRLICHTVAQCVDGAQMVQLLVALSVDLFDEKVEIENG